MKRIAEIDGGSIWLHEDFTDGTVRLMNGRWRVAGDYLAAGWKFRKPGYVRVRNIGVAHDECPDDGTWLPMWMRAG